MEKTCNHMDCRNFIPIDVAKGICHANGDKVILGDGDVCPKFEALPKCKICSKFTNVDEKGIGCCEGFPVKDWTYGDLKAVTCEHFCAAK